MRFRNFFLLVTIYLFLIPSNSFAISPKPGAKCAKAGLSQVSNGKKFTCIKAGKKLVWSKGSTVISVKMPEAEPKQQELPKEKTDTKIVPAAPGDQCNSLGLSLSSEGKSLECRFIAGPKLQWVQLNNPEAEFFAPKSPNGVKPCQLEAPGVGNGFVGFPVSLTRNDMPALGINHVLIAPIDFQDYVGEADLESVLRYQKNGLTNWVDYFSDGKLKFDVKTINHWIRAPKKAAEYSYTQSDNRGIDGNKLLAKYAQEYVDLITKEIDLTGIATIYILYPEDMGVNATDLVPRVTQFNTKEGTRILSVFARSQYDWGEKTPQWVMWIHETAHDWGLLGHTPGNGWKMNIMTNQSGASAALSGWERFLLDWMPNASVYCDTKSNLTEVKISLSALEKDDKKLKMAAIALDNKRVLVVESHAIGRWSEVFTKNKYPNGFYGVVAYVVDTGYTGETIYVKAQGEVMPDDYGNDKRYPRYAYFEPIEGIDLKQRHTYGLNNFPDGTSSDGFTALVGDSFLVEGIRIKVISTGDFETIHISKQ